MPPRLPRGPTPADRRRAGGRARPEPRADEGVFTPIRWNPRGEAVAEHGGRPVRIWSGIVGEQARVRRTHAGAHQDVARWQEGLPPHPDRVTPACPRYQPCGGCPLMHLQHDAQDRARMDLLHTALAAEGVALPEGGVDPLVRAPGGLADFRHVVKLLGGYSDEGSPRFGAPGRNTRHVVPIPECKVVTPTLRELMRSMALTALELELWPWTDDGRGVLRWMVARQSAHTGQVLVTLVAGRRVGGIDALAQALARFNTQICGVHLHLNDGPGNAIFGRDGQGLVGTTGLLGTGYIVERLAGVDVRVGPGDFYQTQPAMADLIARDLLELSGAAPGQAMLDLYAGVGGFTLAFAARTGFALGVEVNEGAVRRARESAQAQHLPAEFLRGEVGELLPTLRQRFAGRRPIVLVDPARRGLEEGVVEAVLAIEPARLLVLSCNPQALARDLRRFAAAGWTLERLRPYDMFPNTAHLEVLAVLRSPGDAPEGPSLRGPQRRRVRA